MSCLNKVNATEGYSDGNFNKIQIGEYDIYDVPNNDDFGVGIEDFVTKQASCRNVRFDDFFLRKLVDDFSLQSEKVRLCFLSLLGLYILDKISTTT